MPAQLLNFRSAKYAAAKTTRSTGGWSPVDSSVNDVIGNSAAQVRARIRQLIRDFPYFARACRVIVDHVVGQGIVFQSRATLKSGKINFKICQEIEQAFKIWSKEADIAGKLSFDEMTRLAKRQDVECGEFILIKRQSKKRGRYVPFCLQMLEADWLTSISAKPKNPKTCTIEQGIEYNNDTGEIVAYHFANPNSMGSPERVTAENIIHGFETLRPGQLRGISPFTPGVIVTKDLQDIMDGEIDGVKMASKWLAFVKVMDPAMRQAQIPGQTTADDGDKIETLENSIIEYLRPGEDIEIASNPRPGDNFDSFIRLILQMFAVSTGVPYELVAGTYEGMNYSVSRASRNDFAFMLQPVSARHIDHFCQPIFEAFLDSAVLAGRLKLPGFWKNPYPYYATKWQPPGMEPVDPLKESRANADELKNNLRSPQEIVSNRGRDLEDVYKEIAAAANMRKFYKLPEEIDVSTATATNPAALNSTGK